MILCSLSQHIVGVAGHGRCQKNSKELVLPHIG